MWKIKSMIITLSHGSLPYFVCMSPRRKHLFLCFHTKDFFSSSVSFFTWCLAFITCAKLLMGYDRRVRNEYHAFNISPFVYSIHGTTPTEGEPPPGRVPDDAEEPSTSTGSLHAGKRECVEKPKDPIYPSQVP